jgi:hypothetical protein
MIEQPDESTARLIQCAFPEGLIDAEYYPLLYLLTREMSLRAASSFVGMLVGADYMYIYNDALGASSRDFEPNMEILEGLKSRLESCGFYKWLDE